MRNPVCRQGWKVKVMGKESMCESITEKFNQFIKTVDDKIIKFIINNFNGRMINFTLYDTRFITVDNAELNQTVNTVVINTAWTLILQLTPIDNDPNNYQLRHGL